MTEAPLRSGHAGRFEDDLLAIVGGADRTASGFWHSATGSIGIGWAVVLVVAGAGLLMHPGQERPVPSVPAAQVAAPTGSFVRTAPPTSESTSAPIHDAAASTVAPPARVAAQGVSLVPRHLAKHHGRVDEDTGSSAIGHQQHVPFAAGKPVTTELARATGDMRGTGTVENAALAEQERSDHASPSKQAVIATRDALRDLRLR